VKPLVVLIAAVALLLSNACAPGDAPAAPSPEEAPAAGEPWFAERSEASGLVFAYRSGHVERFLFPEIIGGGAALFDMDGDDDLDAYLVQGGSLDGQAASATNRLFANQGDGTFVDVTEGSGSGDDGYGMGVATGDYDNDGDVDLYVTNLGANVLLRNDGGGRFDSVGREAGVADEGWGTSTTFLDYDEDGFLDLFVANYLNWSLSIEQDCYNTSGLLDYCLPTNYGAPAMDRLFRNRGDGTFEDVSIQAGLDAAFGNGMGVVASDFDLDGDVDLFVANDTMTNQLWMNDGAGGFVNEALLRGCALDENGMAKAGMGVAADDVDDDGDFDLLVVNMEGQTDSFFRNQNGLFSDHTGAAGLAASSRRFTRFGVGWIDFDNDGQLDLYQANGRVVQSAEPVVADSFAEINLLLRGQGGGTFTEVQPRGGTQPALIGTSRAVAFGDVNGDGGIDALVVNRDGPAYLLINTVPQRGNSSSLTLLDRHGRVALGAYVTLRVGGRLVHREVRSGFGYCGASDPRLHLGLGAAAGIEEVTVRWPGGATELFGPLPAGAATLRQGDGRSR